MGKIVKKILLIIILLFFIINPSYAAQKTEKIFYGYCKDYLDLSTYKYDSAKNAFSVDILYDITGGGDAIPVKSPYDKNVINFVTLGTKYYPATGQVKVWYKGFSSEHMYYEPYNPKIFNDDNDTYVWTIISTRKSYRNNYAELVTGKLFKAYKEGKLSEEGFKESVEVYYKK